MTNRKPANNKMPRVLFVNCIICIVLHKYNEIRSPLHQNNLLVLNIHLPAYLTFAIFCYFWARTKLKIEDILIHILQKEMKWIKMFFGS